MPSRKQCISRNIPGNTFLPNGRCLDWSFAEIRSSSTMGPNGIIGPQKWFSKSPFILCFPISQEVLNTSQIAATFHGTRPPTFNSLFTENFLIRCDQVTKMFRPGHDCTSTSSARSPCYFLLQADITIWVLRKVRIYTVLTRTRFHFCSRLHWKFMRGLGNVLTSLLWVSRRLCWSTFIHQILSQFLQPIRQFMRYISLYSSDSPVISVDSCSGFPRSSPFVPLLLSDTGFSTSLFSLFADIDSCEEDGQGVDQDVGEEELADNLGTTNGTQLDILQSIFLPFLMKCGFWPLVQWYENPWSSQSFSMERTARVSSRSITLTKKFNCLTFSVASSPVCTSPLAVITVVGLLDVLMVSNSEGLMFFLLTICKLAPESTSNSLSSGSFVDAAGSTHSSAGKQNVASSFCLSLYLFLARFQALLRAHRRCRSVSSRDLSSNFIAWWLRWWGAPAFIFPTMVLSFPGYSLDVA